MTTAKINTYQYGTTVRFEARFYNFDGTPIDPDAIKVIIYNQKYEVITTIDINSNNKLGVGYYYYDYVTENKEQKIYYEWNGMINQKPALKRGSFMTKFM